MFCALGLPRPLLWELVMGLLSIVPVLGAFTVWIPAAVPLLLDGSWVRALILPAWGGTVVGGIDSVLRPMLIGNRLRRAYYSCVHFNHRRPFAVWSASIYLRSFSCEDNDADGAILDAPRGC